MSINCFVPSKDRAAQLLLLLESFDKNCPGLFSPTIMFAASTQEFLKGYNLLSNQYGSRMYFEYDCREQFYKFLKSNRGKVVALFSDDCIFYRDVDLYEEDIQTAFKNENLFTFTFRLGKNVIIKDYILQDKGIIPPVINEDLCLYWDYTQVDFWQLWGFPVGFDGYLFRADDLLSLSEEDYFPRICEWEHMICKKFLAKGSNRKLMACPKKSSVFVQNINVSHEFPFRTTHTFNASLKQLNDIFLENYQIDLNSMSFDSVNCTHGEIPFEFKERM